MRHVLSILLAFLLAPTSPGQDYAAHKKALQERLPHDGFTIVIQEPFVVIGDEAAADVRRRARQTVKWCVEHLKKSYFKTYPDHIIDVWLFKDKGSYIKHSKLLWGATPDTPFGYYSSSDKAIVMNIATGGGTLCHEIVHPFIAANFPSCPSWFNEGLASLYEQCGENDGEIWGYTNWRLRGLRAAIMAKELPSFEQLCATSSAAFYGPSSGRNYAQARYLMLWLQEHGKLRSYYRAFRENVRKDPSGYGTLRATLGTDDMDAWQRQWEAWALTLIP